jgi:secreted trypsin-like serine protease
MRLGFVALAGLIVGCSTASRREPASSSEAIGAVSQPIINGTKDASHEAVVFVYGAQGTSNGASCTGTIVKTDAAHKLGWVLTAAHCVTAIPPLVVIQGANISASATLQFSVLDYLAHPSYDGTISSAYDLAVIRIVGVDASTPSIPLTTSTDGVAVASTVTSIGYGRTETSTEQNPNEDRRAVSKAVGSVSASHIGYSLSGSGICQGDSGGPVLFKSGGVERVVGVHSYVAGGCTGEGSGTGYSIRVQSQLSWINTRLAVAAPSTSCDLCEKTANSGNQACAAAYRTCERSAECKALYDCVLACGSSSSCRTACDAKYPNAVGPFLYAAYCSCNQACTTECKSSCSGVPKCGRAFGKNVSCNVCLEGACCDEGLACTADGECYACWNSSDASSKCATNAKRQALLKCQATECQSSCDLGDGGAPPVEEPPPAPEEPPSEEPAATVTTTTTTSCAVPWAMGGATPMSGYSALVVMGVMVGAASRRRALSPRQSR